MNDVENEADAARHRFSNKAPVSFIFWEPLIIIDDQWLRKYESHRRFIGEAVPYAIGLYQKRDVFDIRRCRKAQLMK